MIPHKLTMIPGFGRTGFGRDEIYPEYIHQDEHQHSLLTTSNHYKPLLTTISHY